MEAELALVNKVELRIALAGSDDKFESALDLYLAPLLLKLASPHSQVRTQILKSVQHLITRINAAAGIKLPVSKLVEQVKSPVVPQGADASNVRLYTLVFLSKGIDRLSKVEKLQLVPALVSGISKYTRRNVQARIFYNFLKLVQQLHEADELDLDGIDDLDFEFLVDCISKLLLFQPITNEDGSHKIPENYTCPGLASADCQFLTTLAGVSFSSQQLAVYKLPVLVLLTKFPADKRLTVPLVIACADSSTAVSDKATSILRRSAADFEDPVVIDRLIALYVGELGVRPAVKPVLQEKILSQVLNRSRTAARSLQTSKISSVGLNSDYGRLKSSAIQFIQWVTQNLAAEDEDGAMDTDDREAFNVNIAAQLRENLSAERWDAGSNVNYHNYITQRRSQYQALGIILKRDAKLLNGIGFILFLFEALGDDVAELRPTIQDCLSGVMVHLAGLSDDDKAGLKTLFTGFLADDSAIDASADQQHRERIYALRYSAVKFVNACFPFDDTDARMLCVLGTATTNRSNIVEEAEKGLHPHWFSLLQSSNTTEFKSTAELLRGDKAVRFPKFVDMVRSLKAAVDRCSAGAGGAAGAAGAAESHATLAHSMHTATQFLVQCLVMEAVADHRTVIATDQEWVTRLEKALEFDETVAGLVKARLANVAVTETAEFVNFDDNTSWNSLDMFLSILSREFIGRDATGHKVSVSVAESKAVFGKQFVQVLALCHNATVAKLAPALDDFCHLLLAAASTLHEDVAAYTAQAIGVIGSHRAVPGPAVVSLLEKLVANSHGNHRGAAIAAAGNVVARLQLRGRRQELPQDLLMRILQLVVEGLAASDSREVNASLEAVVQLSVFGVLGPASPTVPAATVDTMVAAIRPMVKKCSEKAVVAWACISLCRTTPSAEELDDFERAIHDTHVSKQVEYLFTSGEAWSIVAGGWNSKVLHRMLDVNDDGSATAMPQTAAPAHAARLPFLLDTVLADCASTKPALRKAGCIWLLSLVQYLSQMPAVKDRAAQIHLAFMRFLADRDELVQESASRGLSLVYELGDSDLKESLVKGLLKSFTEGASAKTLAAGSVGADTQLFEPGVLRTDDGSVSTYKDILNLASEVGDPGLVYKFMSLARHSALWSSRKGIAFGLGAILSKSSLDELLAGDVKLARRLVPKLFRYRFDPSPSVARSMDDIWNTLISDSAATISTNFDDIVGEVLRGIGSREWRVRQASAAALTDLIQSVAFERFEPRLDEVWSMSLRAVDDIKESVRKEGTRLSRALATILVRNINVEAGASAAAAERANTILKKLVPTLLGTQGLLSDVDDIRNFALETILSLCKKSGRALKPFVPELVDQLIALMSTLEPQIVNYLALNADKYNMTASDIDAKRLQGVGQSPMMDAVERLLDLADDATMAALVPALQSSIRKSIGLPSKAAASRVLVTLVVRHLYVVKPHGDALLKTCQQQLKDRNETVAAAFATAAGYLCRVASIEAVVKFSKYLQKLYFESSENEQYRKVSGVAAEAVSKYSGDAFSGVATAFLPFAFVAKHDPDDSVKVFFDTVWSDNTAGAGAVKLYIAEIAQLANKHLESPQYLIKQVCAKSIADACNKIENGANGIGAASSQLFDILMEACKGRSWAGKEDVLDALVSLAVKSKFYLLKDEQDELLEKVKKVVLVEARRNNLDYKRHAVKSMGRFVKEFHELQDEYVEIMTDYIERLDGEDDDDDDDVGMSSSKKARTDAAQLSRKSLKKESDRLDLIAELASSFSFNGDGYYHEPLLTLILTTARALLQGEAVAVTWRSQIGISKALSAICTDFGTHAQKIDSHNTEVLAEIYLELFKILDYTIENVVIQFTRAVKQIAGAVVDQELRARLIADLDQVRQRNISSVVRLEVDSCIEAVRGGD